MDAALKALAGLVERITPWLVEVGSWILGGMIAVNLVVIAALITVGPVDVAVRIAVTAFACALPLDVAGIVLLRLIKDVGDIRIDDLALKAFQKARFPHIEVYFPPASARRSLARRSARIALGYAVVLVTLAIMLTLIGIAASLWHMAAWIAEVFLATVAASALLMVVAAAHAMPPETAAEQALKRGPRDPRVEKGEPA